MGRFKKKGFFKKKYYRKSACKTNKKVHIKKSIYLGQVIKILIFVNKNIKYDIY